MTTQTALPSRRSVRERVRRSFVAERWIAVVIILILALFSITMLYPFMWLIFSSFKTGADIVRIPVTLLPETWSLEAYREVLDPSRANIGRGYLNSMLVTFVQMARL